MALTQQGAARRRKRTEELERPAYGWIWKPLLTLLVLYLAVCVGLGIWWSRTPAPFDVEQAVADQRGAAAEAPAARGAVTVAGLMTLVETLLEKPGGYLRNDVAPPGVWLDNMPAWELGVLVQARRLSVALPAMAQADRPALAEVQERLAGDSGDWLYPSTEQRLSRALEGLDGYLKALGEGGEAAFGDGGQGLVAWLEAVTRSLDDLGLRLSASVASRTALRDLDIDAEALPARTPWYRVDDVFFEARGQAWALLHLLQAVQRDQADALAAAGLTARWEALIAELELSQRRLWSPLVLNGSGFGLFANHSLVLANHMIRARDLSWTLVERLAAAEEEGGADSGADETAAAPVEPAPDAAPEASAGEADAADAVEAGSAVKADGEIPADDQAEAASEVADGAVDASEPTGDAAGEGVAAADPEAETAPATEDSPSNEAAGEEAAEDEAAEDEAVGEAPNE